MRHDVVKVHAQPKAVSRVHELKQFRLRPVLRGNTPELILGSQIKSVHGIKAH